MESLTASIAVAVDRPGEAFGRLRRMIERHGLEPEPVGAACVRYRFERNEAVILREAGGIGIRVAADDPATLFFLKETAEAYLAEIEPSCVAAIAWSHDDGPAPAPGLRQIVLRRTFEVFPGMRRCTFAAEDLAPFAAGGLHVRLLVPPSRARPPRWPVPGPGGGLIWPDAPDRPLVRAYTLRHVRPAAGEIDIDVLMHGPMALAGWAADARPGERLAMLGPGGGGVPPDGRWLLLGGDATAMPALARILEARPGASGRCVVCAPPEAAGYLGVPAGVPVTLLPPDRSEEAVELLRAIVPPAGARPFVWFAGERAAARALRAHFRQLPGVGREDMSVSSYWRRDAGADMDDRAEARDPNAH